MLGRSRIKKIIQQCLKLTFSVGMDRLKWTPSSNCLTCTTCWRGAALLLKRPLPTAEDES